MPDIADNAQQHIEQELEAAIRAARGIVPPDTRSAEVCQDCGEMISSERQNAVRGCTLCTFCAETLESRLRRGL